MHPIFLEFDSFEIRWYGIMIGLAFLAGTWIGVKEARRKGYDPELIFDLLFYVMIAGLIGARLYYVLASNPSYFIHHPLDILAIWRGGLALHGGLIGGLLAGIWFCKKRGLSFWDFADLMTPSVILGQAVGRMACTLNGCSFGRPTTLPWAIMFTDPKAQAPHNILLHPTQFYEMGIDLLIFLLIWNLRKRMRFEGQLFLAWMVSYSIARFILEVFRGDSLYLMPGVPIAQVTSFVLFILAIGFYLKRKSLANPTLNEFI
jgi:phosphatidylglycerol---prolipoprotein diacylglyceryl transferase